MDNELFAKCWIKILIPACIVQGIGSSLTFAFVSFNASMYWHGVAAAILGAAATIMSGIVCLGYYPEPTATKASNILRVGGLFLIGVMWLGLGINLLWSAWNGYWIQP